MAELTLYQFSNMIKGFSIAIGVALAIGMTIVWWRHARRATAIDRAARAKSIYSTYLLQAMEHPELARPDSSDLSKPRSRAQYQWFVGYLLTTAEEIMLIDPTVGWRDTLARQLFQHRDFLVNPAFRCGPYRNLTAPVREVVDTVIANAPANVPRRPNNVSPLRATR